MTVLLHDAKSDLHTVLGHTSEGLLADELVYADDTLILGLSSEYVQQYMACIQQVGQEYGLSFNWSKLEATGVRTDAAISKPDGTQVVVKDSMLYLGGLLSADGRIGAELARRIGAAKRDFATLTRVWSKFYLSIAWKVRVFSSCIVTKLVHGLATSSLNQAERRRLDGFQARCLRTILRIPAAYYSRISNQVVLSRAGQHPLSKRLLKEQMMFIGRLARRPHNDPVRNAVFEPYSFVLRPLDGPRKVGRPRLAWGTTVYTECVQLAGTRERLASYWQPGKVAEQQWSTAVRRYCT